MRRAAAPSRSSPVPVLRVILEPSPDGTSFAAYRANSASFGEVGLLADQAAAEFWFRSRLFQTPNVMAFRASSSGHTFRRGPEHVALGNDVIAVLIAREGVAEAICGERRLRQEPGDVVVRDFAQPCISENSAYDLMALMVARDRVPAALVLADLSGTRIPAADGAARLLAGSLAALLEAGEALSIAEFEAGAEGIFAMLVGALAERSAPRSPEALRARALAFIDQHLAEPDLCPGRLAVALGLSRSSLYRLFEPLGGVNTVVLRRRLDRIAKAILTGQGASENLARIAAKVGFRDEARLTRAFRRRFGLPPRAFQAMTARTDPESLAVQAERAGFVGLAAWLRQVENSPA